MQYAGFFSEIFESVIVAQKSALQKYLPYLKAHFEGKILEFPERDPLQMALFNIDQSMFSAPAEKPENAVSVIPVKGLITREGSWWDAGADDYADMMQKSFDDPSIKSVVIRMNSTGGSIDSTFPIKAAFGKKNKPVIGAIDSRGYSMGYYYLSFCDKIFAVDDMAGLGSIGVMSRMEDWDEALKKEYGVKIHEIYPPESQWKNKAEREAMKGKYDLLISETLSPWAQDFQDIVRRNRPDLNETVEGVLEGRTFFAKDCKPNGNGLIDGIMPFDQIVKYAADYERNDKMNMFFK